MAKSFTRKLCSWKKGGGRACDSNPPDFQEDRNYTYYATRKPFEKQAPPDDP
jgi:hypothetical protein